MRLKSFIVCFFLFFEALFDVSVSKAEDSTAAVAGAVKPDYCPAEYDPAKPAPDTISGPDEFVRVFAPVAVAVQKETGIPASYMIAQAAFESAWGTSYAYKKLNNLFGYSCDGYHEDWRPLGLPLRGRSSGNEVTVEAKCAVARPANEGGYYESFRSKTESFWAIAYLLVNERNTPWGALRNLLAENEPPRALSPRVVLRNIPGYQTAYTDAAYGAQIMQTINYLKLQRFDLCY